MYVLVIYNAWSCWLWWTWLQAALPGRRKASKRKRTHPSVQGRYTLLFGACMQCSLLIDVPLLFNLSLFLLLFFILLFDFWTSSPPLPPSLPPSLSPSLLPTGSTKRRIEVLTISDIEKEYLLVRAKLRLLLRDQTMTTQLSSKKPAMVCCCGNCSKRLCMCTCACVCVCVYLLDVA